MKRLIDYFSKGAVSCSLGESIGMEIETQFLNADGAAISMETSQQIIKELVARHRWQVATTRGILTTEIVSPKGDRILYELGRHNIEISTIPLSAENLIKHAQKQLNLLYAVAANRGAVPFFGPILETTENLLAIPDERDATWLKLDGKEALNLLTSCSAVQFTIDIAPAKAIGYLNSLGASIERFLIDYPQDRLWRKYINISRAGYNPLRYGGPLFFEDLIDYCQKLTQHKVVIGLQTIPLKEVANLDIPLFLRSIWWYFRLKRYGSKLCIEVRPMARQKDEVFEKQLDMVMNLFK